MLRTSIRSASALGSRPLVPAVNLQWRGRAAWSAGLVGKRYLADAGKPGAIVIEPVVLPASETTTAPTSKLPILPEQSVGTSTILVENVPLTPPAPPAPSSSAITASDPPPPPPPPPPAPRKKGFFQRLRNYVLTLTLLGVLGFAGGVWYSRINDNFHDFFTEYVPFGEQAVLYLEEMDFRKRFPKVADRVSSLKRDNKDQVKVPAQSGASWRVADSSQPGGRQSSAVRQADAAKDATASSKKDPSGVTANVLGSPSAALSPEKPPTAVAGPVPVAKDDLKAPPPTNSSKTAKPATSPVASPTATKGWKAPEVNEPSRFPPASPIDPLKVNGASEPLVQDLVRMLNDIITVVNADGANEKYGTTIGKAKNELNKVVKKIEAIKASVEQTAASKVKARVDDFDKAANALVSRVESAMAAQETEWRHEFESEMTKLKESYDEKVKTVVDREQQISNERINNQRQQQAVELQRRFAQEVKDRVEQERNSRLGKLEDLSSAVSELDKLTSGWNDVVDINLSTQQLHVAVDAVRASIQDSVSPRPFIRELVALKETARGDDVVGAAIASIHPTAYQRGVPSPSELIDRFRRVATEVRKASLLPDDAGVASHASSWILSKVLFKKQGLAAGDDVESTLTRTQTYLEEGDLDNAAREMNGLTGWAKTLSRDWLGEVRKVLEVQQALEVIQTEARLQSLKVE